MKKRRRTKKRRTSWGKRLAAFGAGPLDIATAAAAGAVAWTLVLLSTGLLNTAFGYGADFLKMFEGLYPGYRVGPDGIFILTLFGLLDGAFCAGLFALIYNRIARLGR